MHPTNHVILNRNCRKIALLFDHITKARQDGGRVDKFQGIIIFLFYYLPYLEINILYYTNH